MPNDHYENTRDLLRSCFEGNREAQKEFQAIFGGTVSLAIWTTLKQTRIPPEEIAQVVVLCTTDVYRRWQTLPRPQEPFRSVLRKHAQAYAQQYLVAWRLAELPPAATPLSALFARDQNRFRALLMKQLKLSKLEADDVVQETFLELVRRTSDLPKDEEHARNFVAQLILWRGHDEVRRRTRRANNEATIAQAIELPSADLGPEAHADAARLRQAVAQLGKPYQEIITLMLDRDLSLAEVARALGIPLKSIYKQYFRALQHLRRLLHLPERKE